MAFQFTPSLLKKAERWVIVLVALTVFITLAVTLTASQKSLADHVYLMPWSGLAVLFIVVVVESFIRSWRYNITAKVLGLKVPYWKMTFYYTVGYGLLPTPGKVGTLIRLWLLNKYHGYTYQRTAPLIVMDLLSDSIGLMSLAALSLAIVDDPRLKAIGWLIGVGLAVGVTMSLITPHLITGFLKKIHRLLGKPKPQLFERVLEILHTAKDVLGWKTIAITSSLSFVGWGMVGIAIALMVSQMGYPITAAVGNLAISLSTMGGFLTMAPAGVGGAELGMAGIFGLYGVPLAEAVLATALIRILVLWMLVALGLALMPFALRGIPKTTPTPR